MYSVMGGMKSAKHLSAENFPASYELNSPWFFIHESERHAFFTCHVGKGGGSGEAEVGGCVIAPRPIGVHPSSASMKDPEPSHKKKI